MAELAERVGGGRAGGRAEASGSQGWRSSPSKSEPRQDAEANVPPERPPPTRRARPPPGGTPRVRYFARTLSSSPIQPSAVRMFSVELA